jgi:hypothetical protein
LELIVINVSPNQIQLLSTEFVNATMDMLILMEHAFYQLLLISHATQGPFSIIKSKDAFHAQMDVSDALVAMLAPNVDHNTRLFHQLDYANKFAVTDSDTLYHVMMETTSTATDAAKIVKSRSGFHAMEDLQTAKTLVPKLFQVQLPLLHQANLTYMERLFSTFN